MLSRRMLTGIAVVVDVALLARSKPVASKILAARLGRPPRHLEVLLQSLVRARLLRSVRGPHGGYELARERRRITLGEIVRGLGVHADDDRRPSPARVIEDVLRPALGEADRDYLQALDAITVQDVTKMAEAGPTTRVGAAEAEFHI